MAGAGGASGAAAGAEVEDGAAAAAAVALACDVPLAEVATALSEVETLSQWRKRFRLGNSMPSPSGRVQPMRQPSWLGRHRAQLLLPRARQRKLRSSHLLRRLAAQ